MTISKLMWKYLCKMYACTQIYTFISKNTAFTPNQKRSNKKNNKRLNTYISAQIMYILCPLENCGFIYTNQSEHGTKNYT